MAIPRDQMPIGGGFDPTGNENACFFVDREELDRLREDGPEWKYHDTRFIEEAVQTPDAIFEGLRRQGLQESLCYAVRVTFDPEDENKQGLPRYGYVFVVLLRPGVGGYVAFDWE